MNLDISGSLAIRANSQSLEILDQTAIPREEKWIRCETPQDMIECIVALKVRGAPLIGVSAAAILAYWIQARPSLDEFKKACQELRDSRPTAVNLMWAIDRILPLYDGSNIEPVVEAANQIFREDCQSCDQIGDNAAPLIPEGANILTHCNTGGLATAGIGTAFGAIRRAHEDGKKIHVYVDETRPLLQGGRLTTWELKKIGVPYTLITDSMAASLMRDRKIDLVMVGADRIATNGDFANKIGTYNAAICAHHHQIPFYTLAPRTTLDLECPSGAEIPIELRREDEVRGVHFFGESFEWAPSDGPVYNPAFDVTPVHLLTGIVLDDAYFTRAQILEGQLKPS